MNKLLTITLRWMRKDKKRTLLTFLAILMAVYMMIVLGVYFSSSISVVKALHEYDYGSAHISFVCDSPEQAKKLSMNASVEESAIEEKAEVNVIEKYKKEYLSRTDASYVLVCTVNGRSGLLEQYRENPTTYAFISGDLERLHGGATVGDPQNLSRQISTHPYVIGRMPEKAGEVMLSSRMAQRYGGLAAGDKLKVGCYVIKNGVSYRIREEDFTTGEKKEQLDSDGKPLYIKDTDNFTMRLLNREYPEGYSDGGLQYEYNQLDSRINDFSNAAADQNPYFNIHVENRTTHQGLLYYFKTDLNAEKAYSAEYTFDVVGVVNDRAVADFTFYNEDPDASDFLRVTGVDCYVRIREGYDIDEEEKILRKNVGIPDDYYDVDNKIDHVYSETNDMVIFLEGRGLDTSADPMLVVGVIAALTALFMLFTRLIINNAFELSSAYRTEQYAALATVGTSKRQIFAMVVIECLIYAIAALPLATLLAFATGKYVMSKIMDIKIFDVLYGSGVSDTFFTLRIIPAIMVFIVLITLAEIVISAYASASRILRMSALRTVSAGGVKPVKPKKKLWLTKRLFGFPAGYAARSTARSSMRFFITLISTVMSGIILVTIISMIYAIDKTNVLQLNRDIPDYELRTHYNENGISKQYEALVKSGLFKSPEPIRSKIISISYTSPDKERMDKFFTEYFGEEFLEMYKINHRDDYIFTVNVIMMNREYYSKLGFSVSYDELLKKGGVLMSSKVLNSKGSLDNFPHTDIDRMVFPVTAGGSGGAGEPAEIGMKIAAFDEVRTDDLGNSVWGMQVIVPVENASDCFEGIGSLQNNISEFSVEIEPGKTQLMFMDLKLNAADGKQQEASDYLKQNYSSEFDSLYDNTVEKRTNDNISRALKIAGLSFAIIVFAVALLNIVSNSAANIVNRRRELSMLRACGMSLRQQLISLTAESVFCALMTAAASAVLGTLLARFLFMLIDIKTEMPTLPWETSIGIGVLVLMLILVTYLPTLWKMSKASIAEDIKSKE